MLTIICNAFFFRQLRNFDFSLQVENEGFLKFENFRKYQVYTLPLCTEKTKPEFTQFIAIIFRYFVAKILSNQRFKKEMNRMDENLDLFKILLILTDLKII